MSSIVKPLYQLIQRVILCQDRLSQHPKLNDEQLQQIFTWLDFRKRGQLTISDFYTKFPQLNERQLFYVYGCLDIQKNNYLTVDNLKNNPYLKSKYNSSNNNPIPIFINIMNAITISFHQIQTYKQQLNITQKYLQQAYDQINFINKDKINIQDLLFIFKSIQCQINSKLIFFLQNHPFHHIFLNRKQFVHQFLFTNYYLIQGKNHCKYSCEGQTSIPNSYLKNNVQQTLKKNEKLDYDIDKILSKYKSSRKNVNSQQIKQISNFHSPQTSSDKFKTKNYSKFDQSNSNDKSQDYPVYLTYPYQQQKIKQKSTNNQEDPQNLRTIPYSHQIYFTQSSKDINTRRQQLRKGSIQRQKIIDSLMNKRKSMNKQITSNKLNMNDMQYPKYQLSSNQFKQTEKKINHNMQFQPSQYKNTSKIHQFQKIQKFANGGAQQIKAQDYPSYKKQFLYRSNSATRLTNSCLKRQSLQKQAQPKDIPSHKLSEFHRNELSDNRFQSFDKQNLLKRAQEDALKKIQQIQKNARLKVMQKRSAAGLYNAWQKQRIKL